MKLANLGSSVGIPPKLLDQFLPTADLVGLIPALGKNAEAAFGKGANLKWSRRAQQTILNPGRQFKEVHYLCNPSPGKVLSCGDFGLGERGVIIHLFTP